MEIVTEELKCINCSTTFVGIPTINAFPLCQTCRNKIDEEEKYIFLSEQKEHSFSKRLAFVEEWLFDHDKLHRELGLLVKNYKELEPLDANHSKE